MHVAVVGHGDDLAVVLEEELLVDVRDVVHGEIELQLADPVLEGLEVPAVVRHVGAAEHDQIPRTLAGVELEQGLGHEGVEGDHLGLELDAQLVVEILLDEGERVLHVLGVDDRAHGGALVGASRARAAHAEWPLRRRRQPDHHRRRQCQGPEPSHCGSPFTERTPIPWCLRAPGP